jgi:hypothetical protein
VDTHILEVQFPDSNVQEYGANFIAEHIYSQVDDEGCCYLFMDEIGDHQKDRLAVAPNNLYYTNKHGVKQICQTSWQLLLQWKDGSTSWIPLKDLKESNPVDISEYDVASKLVHEPAFAWWVPNVLWKQERIISVVKARYLKRTHKFGIHMLKLVKEALKIDCDTDTYIWVDAIRKEMKNSMPAFKVLKPHVSKPVGHTWTPCHMVFAIKMDFTCKARFVAGGHNTDPPSSFTYTSVVLRESV